MRQSQQDKQFREEDEVRAVFTLAIFGLFFAGGLVIFSLMTGA